LIRILIYQYFTIKKFLPANYNKYNTRISALKKFYAALRFMSDKYSPYSIFASKGKETEITLKEGLTPGMIGGSAGFDGAEC